MSGVGDTIFSIPDETGIRDQVFTTRVTAANIDGTIIKQSTEEGQDALKNVLETTQKELLQLILLELKILNTHMSKVTDEEIKKGDV